MKPNINTALVETILADQFPQWSGLRVREVLPNGWDNRTFRLGDEMSIRLPSAERYVAQVEKEQRWLPVLARQLPLAIPTPLETGEPSDDYPWRWSVYSWIEGETAVADRIKDMPEFARDLSGFLSALHGIDTTGAPSAGQHNFYRGGALSVYDGETRRAIEISKQNSDLDTEAFTDIWDIALSSTWQDLPVWIHGDVSSGNL
nr:aminoglycoside phosphotransferase family protein [Chloroflexota bacterium]